MIDPRTLKGFRDYPPELMLPREWMLETARRVYRSYGFAPIDTPALEYAEILMDKGGEESNKLVYQFQDHGKREVALRFDLTVPFARFAAQHIGQLGTPFKRYAMGPVWRGENTGHGRYREFWQCDFDTIGTTANAADIEVLLVINDLFEALGLSRFTVRINNRLVLNGLLEELGLAEKAVPLLRSLDKLAKVGPEKVRDEMVAGAGVRADQAETVLALAELRGTNAEILDRVERNFGCNAKAADGIARLRELVTAVEQAGVPAGRLQLDLAIARGLDYYTGTIYETFLTDKPDIGSVCSGGRYDNLASLFTKQVLPGVGASLGLDRLLTAMEEMKILKDVRTAPVLIVNFGAQFLGRYQQAARELRAVGIGVEVYPEEKKLPAQFQYAEKRRIQLALVAGDRDFAKGVWQVRNMETRQSVEVPAPELVAAVQSRLPS